MFEQLDTQLLLFLNGFHSSFWDHFMWGYTSKYTWIPLYMALIAYAVLRWRKRSIYVIAALILSVCLADYIASGILKPLVGRLRPSWVEELQGVLHLIDGYKSGLYGFVSSHAANTVGVAALFALLSKERAASATLWIWAVLNAYSRIYMGVHYPGDIIGGALIGVGVALLCYYLLRRFYLPLFTQTVEPNRYLSLIIPTAWLLTVVVLLVGAVLA